MQAEQQFLLARQFVLPYEKYCCSLMQRIIARERFLFIVSRTGTAPAFRDVAGVFCYTDGELLLPCLPSRDRQLLAALSCFFARREVFCISGGSRSVHTLMAVLRRRGGQQIREEKRHLFMEFQDAAAGLRAGMRQAGGIDGCTVQRCSARDADALMPLQLSYKVEEVLPAGVPVSPAAERLELDRTLKVQTVFALRRPDGSFAAKAQTNACCERYMQIGGVFTRTDCRGRGYAAFLVRCLAADIVGRGRKAVLFVNRRNAAAIRAYQNAGFVRSGSYLVVYYDEFSPCGTAASQEWR